MSPIWIYYLIGINTLAFFIMGYDKRMAQKKSAEYLNGICSGMRSLAVR